MRTIINFEIAHRPVGLGGSSLVSERAAEAPAASLPAGPPLFGAVTARAPRERWGRPVVVAVTVHALLIAGFAVAANPATPEPLPSEPEVMFYVAAPPPPPPPAAVAAVQPRVQARRAPRRPTAVVVPQQVEPTPVQAEAPEPTEEVAEVPETPAPAPVPGGVVGGVAGGVAGGKVGGVVGSSQGGALQLSQVLRAPRVLEQVRPSYPRAARLSGTEGLVTVRIIIGADGRVESEHTRILKSVPGLDGAAMEAIARWRFAPALGRDGRAARVIVDVPLNFSLR